jgi:hypothetical protein
MREPFAPCQHSSRLVAPDVSCLISPELQVSQHCALCQDSCKSLCPLVSQTAVKESMQLQCDDVTPSQHRRELVHDNLQVFHCVCPFTWGGCPVKSCSRTPPTWRTPIFAVPPQLAQADNGRRTHLVHLLFDPL